jgi:hypothetical protein
MPKERFSNQRNSSEEIHFHGDLAYFMLSIDSYDDAGVLDTLGSKEKLDREFFLAVHRTLGQQYDIRIISISQGTAMVLIAISIIGGAYVTISQYHDFVESLELLLDQIKNILRRLLSSYEPSIESSYLINPRLPVPSMAPSSNSAPAITNNFFWYMVLSNAALLATLIYILLKNLHN